jgi:hypothetical protein
MDAHIASFTRGSSFRLPQKRGLTLLHVDKEHSTRRIIETSVYRFSTAILSSAADLATSPHQSKDGGWAMGSFDSPHPIEPTTVITAFPTRAFDLNDGREFDHERFCDAVDRMVAGGSEGRATYA